MTPAVAAINETCSAGDNGKVIAVDIAAAKAVAIAQPLRDTERIALLESRGRVLAKDMVAATNLPRFDNSAMDGYAVRTLDFDQAGLTELSD